VTGLLEAKGQSGLGIAGGLGLAVVAAGAMQLPFILDPAIVLIAFGFSAAVGVVFG